MKIEGTRSFDAQPQVVWDVLNDPSRMAKLMPGVESFEIEDDRHWRAKVKVPLGLGGLPLSFRFEKLEERPIEYARLRAKGQGVGAMINMETAFHLAPEGSGTGMRWEADFGIAGPVGSMGQRVLQPIVNQQVSNVLAALERQVQEASTSSTPGGSDAMSQEQEQEPVIGATPTASGEDVLRAGAAESGAGDTGDTVAPATGAAGTQSVSTDIPPPQTDAMLRDAGPPAESSPTTEPEEGTSAAEQGLNPWDSEAYKPDAEGPRTSTEGDR